MEVSSRNSVSLKMEADTLVPFCSQSDATSQPLSVTANSVAGNFSLPVEKDGACTSKPIRLSDRSLFLSAVRNGSGASVMASSFEGKRVLISIAAVFLKNDAGYRRALSPGCSTPANSCVQKKVIG